MKAVLGGAGFIGRHLSHSLLNENYEVKTVDRSSDPGLGTDHVQTDISDRKRLKEGLKDVETVFIQSGRVGLTESQDKPGKYYKDNFIALNNAIEVFKDSEVEKVVLASSIAVYGVGKYLCKNCGIKFPGKREPLWMEHGYWNHYCSCGEKLEALPLRESDPKMPRTPYSRSKLSSEHLFLDRLKEIDLKILRYPFVYGPQQNGAGRYFFKNIEENRSITLFEDGKQLRDFMYIEDIVKANINALKDSTEKKTYNLGTGKPKTLQKFVDCIRKSSNSKSDVHIPGKFREVDVRNSFPENSRMEQNLLENTTDLSQGIKKTLNKLN